MKSDHLVFIDFTLGSFASGGPRDSLCSVAIEGHTKDTSLRRQKGAAAVELIIHFVVVVVVVVWFGRQK